MDFGKLKSLTSDPHRDLEPVQNLVFKRSIHFSYTRVKNYVRRLCGFIERSNALLVKPGRSSEQRNCLLVVSDLTVQDRQHPSQM